MRRRLAAQEGFTIVIAVTLLGIMLGTALASYAYVDTQQEQSRVQRQDESGLNLGEGVLNAQAFILSRNWPARSNRPYPTCTHNSADGTYCPLAASLAASFDNVDYQTGSPTWVSRVHDDTGSLFYDQAAVDARPTYDANGNDKVWARAEATFTAGPRAGRKRSVVALVQVERVPVGQRFPERTIVAGKFKTANQGKKIIVETSSTETSPHSVTLRCSLALGPACADYESGKGQISPPGAIEGTQYVAEPVVPTETQDALRERARAENTYYATGCPSTLAGAVVWIESASCSYNGNDVVNSGSAPGVVVLGSGSLSLSGNLKYFGVIYALNSVPLDSFGVVQLRGNVQVQGRIFVDGPLGGVDAGSSKVNVIYDDFKNAATPFTAYGTTGIVQNSFRELNVGG